MRGHPRNAVHRSGTHSRARAFKPCQKAVHLGSYLRRGWRLVVHHFAPQRPADDLHGIGVAAYAPHGNTRDARRTPRKQCRLPAAQSVQAQRRAVVGQRVPHHLHQAFHRPVRARRIRQLKPVRHGRARGSAKEK
jgi:hypothetical protein